MNCPRTPPKRLTLSRRQLQQHLRITRNLKPRKRDLRVLTVLLRFDCCREQKDRFLEKAQAESAFAPLEDVEGYLAQFVAKRPDLFGSVDDHAVSSYIRPVITSRWPRSPLTCRWLSSWCFCASPLTALLYLAAYFSCGASLSGPVAPLLLSSFVITPSVRLLSFPSCSVLRLKRRVTPCVLSR